MADYVNKGDVIDFKLAKAAGYHEVIQIGTLAGVTQEAGAIGDTVSVSISGVWKIPTDETLTVGTVAYVKDGKAAAATSDGAVKAGVVTYAETGFVEIKLNT